MGKRDGRQENAGFAIKRMDVLTVILLASVLLLLIFLLLKQSPNAQPDYATPLQMMQQQVESLRSDMRASLQHVTENLNQQLQSVTRQMQSQTSSVGERLDTASRVIGDVQRNLGELGKATQEIKELGQNVSKLEELLRAPKLRGGLGEFLLEEVLKQVLPTAQYVMQYRFKNGQAVDAVIYTSDRMVPVDSKFPLENFRKLQSAPAENEKRLLLRAFLSDVKKHIDAIAGKYILPDEGTFPFALMYIPAEAVYYEVMMKHDETGTEDLYAYALGKRVVPVSPNSFYAYLQVIALGLRGMHIEQRAKEIVNALAHLQTEMEKVRDSFDTLGTHLNNARNKYDETEKRFGTFEQRIEAIASSSVPEPYQEIPEHKVS